MATAACLSSPSLNMSPHTPDAAQLRMIALSVAEAALDSPNLGSGEYIPSPLLEQGRFDNPLLKERSKLSFKSNLGREIWNIAELAVGRKEKENTSPLRSPLEIGGERDARRTLAGLNISTIPLVTRSAGPSPVKSSFDHLDQTRSPPTFVPRCDSGKVPLVAAPASAKETSARGRISPVPALRARIEKSAAASSRHTMRLPSLAQITAKMKGHHRRRSSHGDLPQLQQSTPRRPSHDRNMSAESEILQTPVEEHPTNPRIISASTTPPPGVGASLVASSPKNRLAPLIRERTASRAARPRSMPPLTGQDAAVVHAQLASFSPPLPGSDAPHLKLIEPTPELDSRSPSVTVGGFDSVPASVGARRPLRINFPPPALSGVSFPAGPFSPTKTLLSLDRPMCTPPPRPKSFATAFGTPSSTGGSGSAGSSSASSSPTLSVPIITCTPAPERTVKNGVEQDSDEEAFGGEDVVVFDVREEGEEAGEGKERVRRGEEMRRRLSLRRGSE